MSPGLGDAQAPQVLLRQRGDVGEAEVLELVVHVVLAAAGRGAAQAGPPLGRFVEGRVVVVVGAAPENLSLLVVPVLLLVGVRVRTRELARDDRALFEDVVVVVFGPVRSVVARGALAGGVGGRGVGGW